MPTPAHAQTAEPQYRTAGPYTVGLREFATQDAQRPLPLGVWYPAQAGDYPLADYQQFGRGRALLNADPAPLSAGGPYPLVIFSHGYTSERNSNAYLAEHLASYGFVVISANHPDEATFIRDVKQPGKFTPVEGIQALFSGFAMRPLDVLNLIAFAETLNAPDGPLAGQIDMENIGTTGFSFGGYTALATGGARMDVGALGRWCDANERTAGSGANFVCFLRGTEAWMAYERQIDPAPTGLWPATTDPRIRAVLALAPWNGPIFGEAGLAALTKPTLIMVGTMDMVAIPKRDAYFMYEHLGSAQKYLVTVQNAGHNFFSGRCNDLGCTDPLWPSEKAHDVTNHFATAFLLATLKGDVTALAALTPEAVTFAGVVLRVG